MSDSHHYEVIYPTPGLLASLGAGAPPPWSIIDSAIAYARACGKSISDELIVVLVERDRWGFEARAVRAFVRGGVVTWALVCPQCKGVGTSKRQVTTWYGTTTDEFGCDFCDGLGAVRERPDVVRMSIP